MVETGSAMDMRRISIGIGVVYLTLLIISGGLVWKRAWLPLGYYIIAIGFAVTVPLVFWHGKLRSAEALVALAVSLFITNVYSLYSNYQVLPFADSYADVANLKLTLAGAQSVILPEGFGRLQVASGWPGLQFLALSLVYTASLQPTDVVKVTVPVLNLVYFLLVYLIADALRRTCEIRENLAALSLLLLSGSGFGISLYLFGHANLGLILFTLVLCVVLRHRPSLSSAFVLLVLVGAVTVSHHLASMVTLFLLAVLSLGFLLPWPQSSAWRLEQNSGSRFMLGLSLITVAAVASWLNYRASFLWPSVVQLSVRMARLFSLIGLKDMQDLLTPSAEYPPLLTPHAGLLLLQLRDLLFLLLALAGALTVLIRRKSYRLSATITYSFVALLMLFSISAMATWLAQRIFEFAYPLVATLGAIVLSGLFGAQGRIRKAGASVVLAVVVFGGFIGLWGHRYLPRHLYDLSVDACLVGEHPRSFQTPQQFLQSHLTYGKIRKYASDDNNLLLALLPPSEFSKLAHGFEVAKTVSGKLGVDLAEAKADTLFIQLKCLNVYEYFSRYPPYVVALGARRELSMRLNGSFHRIYNDGWAEVWRN